LSAFLWFHRMLLIYLAAQRPGSAAAVLTKEHSRPHAQAVGWNPVLGHGNYRRPLVQKDCHNRRSMSLAALTVGPAQRPCSAAAGRDPVTCATASSGGRLELMLGGPTAHTGSATPPGRPPNRPAPRPDPRRPAVRLTATCAEPLCQGCRWAFLPCRATVTLADP
jgi:hypothetical protein